MDPIAFKIGGLAIHWYGILMAIGFVLGFWTAGLRGKQAGLSTELVSNLFMWILISGLVGAKLLHVANYWNPQQESLAAALLQRGGLVFQGGLIGAVLATVIFLRRYRMPMWKTLDVLAPSISLGYGFGRLGCLMSGCCHGKLSGLAAYQSLSGSLFPSGEVVGATEAPWLALVFQPGGLCSIHGQPVYPTQLYEAAAAFGLYLMLAWWIRRKAFDGQIFILYLCGASAARFLIEFARGDENPRYIHELLTQGQLFSVALIALAGFCAWRLDPTLRVRAS